MNVINDFLEIAGKRVVITGSGELRGRVVFMLDLQFRNGGQVSKVE